MKVGNREHCFAIVFFLLTVDVLISGRYRSSGVILQDLMFLKTKPKEKRPSFCSSYKDILLEILADPQDKNFIFF